ncbi:tagaturonate reductase [Pedobacter sp. MC2016-14]|uniref:tagaturonate reductase n=1 Tax=Pedobacter sp. MC2016-14 TaxID=2897327 RepID=UPI001E291603|nr:tagaturonate reductase [Pedobacter sp. MC2016-14]MCD0488729.1 tagaturonate reductase [Pedobacter sp. MC2016-14]
MILSKSNLTTINSGNVVIPAENLFNLPEKVLQFGTGVLLRGLPDYFIDKANKQGVFNGRIAVVKSTSKGSTAEFDDQDSLYTLCIRGIENGEDVEENIISSSISRVIVADTAWADILAVAGSADLKLIVSNTTEVGIQLVEEKISQTPPASFPAKLLAVLFERYTVFNGAAAPLVVVATELIPENGKKLEAIVEELIAFNELEAGFSAWMKENVNFCNSLVDRIVPGKPDAETLKSLEAELGYTDNLLSMSEPYRLWAIEGNAKVAELLDFAKVDEGVVITEDIELYRELKVRLLNGTHTLSCGIAYLSGIETVTTAMKQVELKAYIGKVMLDEIVPAIPYKIDTAVAVDFSKKVIDRFANPHIEHAWINITAQYSMKLKIRVLPVLLNYYKLKTEVPAYIAFGFAAYLKFMQPVEKEGNAYYGKLNGHNYPIADDSAAYFYEKMDLPEAEFADTILKDTQFWGADLNTLPGFIAAVEENYQSIVKEGMNAALLGLTSSIKIN